MEAKGSWYHSELVFYDGELPVYRRSGAFNSAEAKPTGDAAADLATGSSFLEVDTGKIYFYDRYTGTWEEQ